MSVGRRPVTRNLNLDRLGIETRPQGIHQDRPADEDEREGIYAIGDVRGPPLLAHKAPKEGIVAAESIAGLPSVAEWKSVPWAIFTDPEMPGVGLTEKQAVEAGIR